MIEPYELYHLVDEPPELDRPVLLVTLTGFVDAGGAARLAAEHLLGALPSRLVATFDVDLLLDYRSRRPPMQFVQDHWEDYDDPRMGLHVLTDSAGTEFLLLAGPEPDLYWERFTAAVRSLIKRFGVRLTVGLNAIPMAVPHTRPTGLTAHATRPELIAGYEPWLQRVQVPASAGHLLEFRLGHDGQDAVGFAVHVPHYLSQIDYPASAESLLHAFAKASDLSLPLASLAELAGRVRRRIDTETAESPDVSAVVRALEENYDNQVGRGVGPMPTAEELGAEAERWLAEHTRTDE